LIAQFSSLIKPTPEPDDFGLIYWGTTFPHSHVHTWIWLTELSLKVAKSINTVCNSYR